MAEDNAAANGLPVQATGNTPVDGGASSSGALPPVSQTEQSAQISGQVAQGSSLDSAQQAAVQAAVESQQAPGIWDDLRSYGVDLTQLPDDRSRSLYLAQVVAAARQMQQELQQLRTQAPLQPAVPAGKEEPWFSKWWDPPEWDSKLESFLEPDGQGGIRVKPGASPDLPAKYLAHQNYLSAKAREMMSNPYEFFKDGWRTQAEQVFSEMFEKQLGQLQQQSEVSRFERDHGSWMYQHDTQGRPLCDPQGNRVPTEHGLRFLQYVSEARRKGLTSFGDIEDYARTKMQRDFYMASQQANPQQQSEQAKQAFVQQGNNASAARPAAGNTVPAAAVALPLKDRLRQNFKQHGFALGDELKVV